MTEEVRTVSSTGGEKGQKEARYSLIPPEALELVAIHYGRGAKKYAEHNWRKGYDWSLSYDAMMRHLQAFWMGEDIDEETGSPHLAAVVFHANTLMVFGKDFPQFDNRFATLLKKAHPESDILTNRTVQDIMVNDKILPAEIYRTAAHHGLQNLSQ